MGRPARLSPQLVELTRSRTVCEADGRELIRLDSQRFSLDRRVIAEARLELLARRQRTAGDFRSGYLLGVEAAEPAACPAVRVLRSELYQQVVQPVGHCRGADFEFSFLKTATGKPPSSEGVHGTDFHLDTHPELTADRGVELLRVLVNLDPTPRRLRFLPQDRFELARRGADVPRSDYQVLSRPPGSLSRTVDIPPFASGEISYLTLWASAVPHVGVDTSDGYFLASFEALATFQ